jgi:hypothetical protein
MRKKTHSSVALVCIAALAPSVRAAEDDFQAFTGNWSSAGSWYQNHAPNNGDTVFISGFDGNTATYDPASATVNSLTIGENNGQVGARWSLTDTGPSTQSLVVNGPLALNPDHASGEAAFLTFNQASMQVSGGVSIQQGGTLTLNGGGSLSGNQLYNNGTFSGTNLSIGTTTIENASSASFTGNNCTVNVTTLNSDGQGFKLNGGSFSATTVEASGPTTINDATFHHGIVNHGGGLTLTGSYATLSGNIDNSGSFYAGATLVSLDSLNNSQTQATNTTVGSNATLETATPITSIGSMENWNVFGTVASGAIPGSGQSIFFGLNSISAPFFLANEEVNNIQPSTGTLSISQTSQFYILPTSTMRVAGNLALTQSTQIYAGGSYGGEAYINVDNTLSLDNSSSISITGAGVSSFTPLGGGVHATEIDNEGNINGGSGSLITVGGTLAPAGSTGYYQLDTGTLKEDIGGSSDFGVIDAGGPAYLAGVLDPVLMNGFLPTRGESFTFLTYDGTYTGPGFTLADAYLPNGLNWSIVYADGSASLVAIPEPATLSGVLVVGGIALSRRQRRRTSSALPT